MSRIGSSFRRCREAHRPAFVAFLTAGDPSLERTEEIAVGMESVDVLELGVPFSDPVADGPAIQRSTERALVRGVTLPSVIALAGRIRKRSEIPLLLFTYFNPLLSLGLKRTAQLAREAGVDGVLVTDLPPEEAGDWLEAAWGAGLDSVFLAAPTSEEERLRRIVACSRGFVYAVSRTGVTGEQGELSKDAAPLLSRLKALADLPIAIGFGISGPEQVKEAASLADGVVVGSALVRFLEERPSGDLREYVRWLKSAL